MHHPLAVFHHWHQRTRAVPHHAGVLGAIPGQSVSTGTGWRNLCGNSSYVRPSSSRPEALFRTPPHCLKKNGMPLLRHWSRTDTTHSFFHWSCPWSALTADNYPMDSGQIEHCLGLQAKAQAKGSALRQKSLSSSDIRGKPCLRSSSTHTPPDVGKALAANLQFALQQ